MHLKFAFDACNEGFSRAPTLTCENPPHGGNLVIVASPDDDNKRFQLEFLDGEFNPVETARAKDWVDVLRKLAVFGFYLDSATGEAIAAFLRAAYAKGA